MALTLTFTCVLPNGVHARPATQVEQICQKYVANVIWKNCRNGKTGDAKSVLSLIATDTLFEDACEIAVSGTDEQVAYDAIKSFIENEFAQCDAPVDVIEDSEVQPLPYSLSNLNPHYLRAKAVSSGVGIGRLYRCGGVNLEQLSYSPDSQGQALEREKLDKGIRYFKKSLSLQLETQQDVANDVLKAHLAILADTLLYETIVASLAQNLSCAEAIVSAARHFSQSLSQSKAAYLRERVLDIQDVCGQLLQHIYGSHILPTKNTLVEDTICLADELTPSQFLEMDKKYLKGLLLSAGGTTSHTVILARSFNIPTLVQIDMSKMSQYLDQTVIVDGHLGIVLWQIDKAVNRFYQQEAWVTEQIKQQYAQFMSLPGKTADGQHVEIAANIAHGIEAKPAFTQGAESIGLFRTEMLYMDRQREPSEQEQYLIYCQAIKAAEGRPIIIRTMDIGGDKPIDYLDIPKENNPFLGYRAIRIYHEYLPLFTTQLRAILRASAHGPLKIMIPMISSIEEILWVKEQLATIKQKLREERVVFDEKIPLGIMLEVPSIMFIIDQCCEEVDFFSIGSNDLTQYLLAVDRDNAKVHKHYNSLNPAFLRCLDHAVREVHRYGKWIGLCGELGAKGSVLPLLVGMELDEISMSAPSIPATKTRMARLGRRECRLLLNKAMVCKTALEVEHLLAQFRMNTQQAPLITTKCINLKQDWRSKEEVIKAMTDNLLLNQRCRYPRRLEADIWAREAIFSTALGFGFAIPHTKSEHIEQSTISIATLKKPIKWGDEMVECVIMLTLNKHAAGDQHMKIFSKLARKIMHDEFRNALIQASNEQAIEQLLMQELEMI